MARIGGKGMTRERDRIQKNTNKYIVRNCPASSKDFRLNCQGKAYIDKYKCVYGLLECQDCTDCVLKRVIELSREEQKSRVAKNILSNKILQLFDIEEINK